MNKILFFALCIALFLPIVGCTNDPMEEEDTKPLHPGIGEDPNQEGIWDVINLSYAGLESVKSAHEAGDTYLAAQALQDYYRNRTNVINLDFPDIEDDPISLTKRLHAGYAVNENRFYVKNFYEFPDDLKPYAYVYANDKTKINWKHKPTSSYENMYQLHRHQWFPDLASMYRNTGDEEYVKSWIRTYKSWLENNKIPAVDSDINYSVGPTSESVPPGLEHVLYAWRPLDAISRVTGQLVLLEYFKNSPSVDPEFMSTFIYNIAAHIDHVIRNYTDEGNHVIFQASGAAMAGILMPEFSRADAWLESGSNRLASEMDEQLMADGMTWECDLGYHMANIESFSSPLKTARINGKSDFFPEAYTNRMKGGTNLVKDITYPTYQVPGFDDTKPHKKSVMIRKFQMYSELLFPDDMEMKWMATQGAQGNKPTHTFAKYTDSGLYALRSGWDSDDMMMAISNTSVRECIYPEEEVYHNQRDNGTFGLVNNGRDFFPDSGVYSYSSSDWAINKKRADYRRTRVHNTMTLDYENTQIAGKYCKSGVIGTTNYLVIENASYDNFTHRRSIFHVNKEFYVLIDEAIGSKEGEVNLNFNLCLGTESEVVLDLEQHGAHTAFDNNNIYTRSFGPEGMITREFEGGEISVEMGKETPRKAYSVNYNKTDETTARFITVLYPTDDIEPSISAEFTTQEDTNVAITVTIDGNNYTLSYSL